MNITSEKAREAKKPQDILSDIFGSNLAIGITDAVYLNKSNAVVFGVVGLSQFAPIASKLIHDRDVLEFIKSFSTSVLLKLSPKLELVTFKGEQKIPSKIISKIKKTIARVYASIGQVDDHGQQIIDLTTYSVGPHYNVNLLLGDRMDYEYPLFTTPKSALDAFGRGSFRSGGAQQVLASRYVLYPEENGEPVNRQFYIVENSKKIFYSLDAFTNVKSAKCIHSQNNTVITYVTKCGLEIERTIIILPQSDGMPEAVEVQRIAIKNLKDTNRNLRIVATGAFGITTPMTIVNDVVYANVVHQSDVMVGKDGRLLALTLHNKDEALKGEKKFATLTIDGEGFDDYTMSMQEFLGAGTLANPDSLAHLPSLSYKKSAQFFAMGKNFALQGKGQKNILALVGVSEDRNGDVSKKFLVSLDNLIERYKTNASFEETLKAVKNNYKRYTSYLRFFTNDKRFDSYVSDNLPFQVLYQTFVSRSFGWTQKAYRETGFREIQDIFSSVNYLVAAGYANVVKNLISMWVENVFEMGYAYHDFTWVGKEPGDCSDDQLWLAQAVYRYVILTGDYAYLNDELIIAGGNGKKRKLIDTLEAILVYSGRISVGKNGLPLLDKADWNDTLRLDKKVYKGPEKEKLYSEQLKIKGQKYGVAWENNYSESVMNACLLKIAADLTAELAREGGYLRTQELAESVAGEIRNSVRKNCWKNNFFVRCMINDSREGEYTYLGAKGDRLSANKSIDGTYFLNSFSWTILADIADESQIATMLDVVEKNLKCEAGLKLCTIVDWNLLGVNTATNLYYPGDRENGGVFKHATMMAATAALKAAKKVSDEKLARRLCEIAEFAINRVLPYKTLDNPYILKGNPRFCTQYNNSVTSENVGPILSGTASWLSLAVYELLGIKESLGEIEFEPLAAYHVPRRKFVLETKSTIIDVEIICKNKNIRLTEKSKITIDGKISQKAIIKKDGQKHNLLIEL